MGMVIAVPSAALRVVSGGDAHPVVTLSPLQCIEKRWLQSVVDSITIIGAVAASRIAAYTSRAKCDHGVSTSESRLCAAFCFIGG